MARDEFSIIQRYFSNLGEPQSGTRLGVGDDAAVIEVPPDHQLVISSDTLISGVHFLPHTAPADIAWKALAVNLSDMAAMAADPYSANEPGSTRSKMFSRAVRCPLARR